MRSHPQHTLRHAPRSPAIGHLRRRGGSVAGNGDSLPCTTALAAAAYPGRPTTRPARVTTISSTCRAPAAAMGTVPDRTTMTKSLPCGSSDRTWRNASRSRRFQRFRTTALPIRRDTDSPSRVGCATWARGHAYNTNGPLAALLRTAYTRAKSPGESRRAARGKPARRAGWRITTAATPAARPCRRRPSQPRAAAPAIRDRPILATRSGPPR